MFVSCLTHLSILPKHCCFGLVSFPSSQPQFWQTKLERSSYCWYSATRSILQGISAHTPSLSICAVCATQSFKQGQVPSRWYLPQVPRGWSWAGLLAVWFTWWSCPKKIRQSVREDKRGISVSSCTWFCCCVPGEKSERWNMLELHVLLLPSPEKMGLYFWCQLTRWHWWRWENGWGHRRGMTQRGWRVSARHQGIPLQLLERFQAALESRRKGPVWSDRIIFFKKYQSVSNYRPTKLWWQEGYTGTKEKQKWICNNVNFLPEPDMALKSSCFGYPRATASAVTTHRARQKPLLSGKTQKAAKLWGTQAHNQAFVCAS